MADGASLLEVRMLIGKRVITGNVESQKKEGFGVVFCIKGINVATASYVMIVVRV